MRWGPGAVNAILAASKGAAVVAVDVNLRAIEAATANAHANGLLDRVEVRVNDVFSNVEEVFGLIVFDHRFGGSDHGICWRRP